MNLLKFLCCKILLFVVVIFLDYEEESVIEHIKIPQHLKIMFYLVFLVNAV